MKTKLTTILATFSLTAGLAFAGSGVPLWCNTNTMDCLPLRSDGGTNNWDEMGQAVTGKVDKAGDFDQFTGLGGASNSIWISNGDGAGEWVSWSSLLARQAATDPAAPLGNRITMTFHYDPDEPYSSGIVHVLAYNNPNMHNTPLMNESYAVTDLRVAPSFTFANTSWYSAITQIWLYAWMDVDANELFNLKVAGDDYADIVTSNYPALEPAAVAEFAPLVLDEENDSHDVDFWMVSDKGGYVRFIIDPNDMGPHIMFARNMSVGGAPTIWRSTNAFLIGSIEGNHLEASYLDVGGDYYGGVIITNEHNATLTYCDNNDDLVMLTYGSGHEFSLNEAPVTAESQSVPTYPVGGATVDVGYVTFAFTNAWNYPGLYLAVGTNAAMGGTLAYEYKGYLENKHWDTGTTYHRANLSALAPGTYYWFTRTMPPMVTATWTATPASTTNSFVLATP